MAAVGIFDMQLTTANSDGEVLRNPGILRFIDSLVGRFPFTQDVRAPLITEP
jgi:hypothetical protein